MRNKMTDANHIKITLAEHGKQMNEKEKPENIIVIRQIMATYVVYFSYNCVCVCVCVINKTRGLSKLNYDDKDL